jgi:hypothetical protein
MNYAQSFSAWESLMLLKEFTDFSNQNPTMGPNLPFLKAFTLENLW